MLKVVVFCGGTGSIALQEGVSALYGIDRIQMDIVVNAYDNGKSTGVCRRVFGNRFLGPSDVRKNQLLQYSIRYREEIRDKTSRRYRLYRLFDVRLSAVGPMEYYQAALQELHSCKDIFERDTWEYLRELLEMFFWEGEKEKKKLRDTTIGEDFRDFALSNVFYAACAAKCGNSLEAAMDRMARILEIRENIHLISDKNLLLKAETQSGHIIEDEAEIVAWDHPKDKIVRAILMHEGLEYLPSVGEGSSHTERSISRIVKEADMIIFSSGTQWSSLIPTYMHRGFRKMIHASSAKKYLIMNNAEDHDALNVGAAELCEVLERYIHMDDLTIVVNECAAESMSVVPDRYQFIRKKLGAYGRKTHHPEALVQAIMEDYYKEPLACKRQFFDLDGTLWNETGSADEKKIGAVNLSLFDGAIISGNTAEHIRGVLENYAPRGKSVDVFADYGNTYFHTKAADDSFRLTNQYVLPAELWEMIADIAIFQGKSVKTRGGVVITIKPIEDRERIVDYLNHILKSYDGRLVARSAGKTSIDVMYADYTKAAMMPLIFERCGVTRGDVVFIGNEVRRGSETGIAAMMGVTTLQVDDVYECYVYLKTRALHKAFFHVINEMNL